MSILSLMYYENLFFTTIKLMKYLFSNKTKDIILEIDINGSKPILVLLCIIMFFQCISIRDNL